MDTAQMAERIGVPTAILVLVLSFIGTASYLTYTKVLTPLLMSFLSLVEEVKKSNSDNSKTLEKMTSLNGEQKDLLIKILRATEVTNEKLSK